MLGLTPLMETEVLFGSADGWGIRGLEGGGGDGGEKAVLYALRIERESGREREQLFTPIMTLGFPKAARA